MDLQAMRHQCYRQSLFQFGLYKQPPQFFNAVTCESTPNPIVTAKERINSQCMIESFGDELLTQNHQLENIFVMHNCELEPAQIEIVTRLGMAAEYRDEETGRHIKRMSRFCRLLAMAIGLSKDEAFLLEKAATMHDIGKIGIPDSILFKQGKFTKHEQRVMQQHTEVLSPNCLPVSAIDKPIPV